MEQIVQSNKSRLPNQLGFLLVLHHLLLQLLPDFPELVLDELQEPVFLRLKGLLQCIHILIIPILFELVPPLYDRGVVFHIQLAVYEFVHDVLHQLAVFNRDFHLLFEHFRHSRDLKYLRVGLL